MADPNYESGILFMELGLSFSTFLLLAVLGVAKKMLLRIWEFSGML